MRARVLGAAAGGGVPQWNCGCDNCKAVRDGRAGTGPRTQTSIAVSTDEDRWWLLGASPDIRGQVEAFPPLHPRGARGSPIAGVLLANGDLDGCLGLLSLREGSRLEVWSTAAVRRGFTEGNVLYRTLQRFQGQVAWSALELGRRHPIEGTRLAVTAFACPGTVPLHLAGCAPPSPEHNVALQLRDAETGATFIYAPTVSAPPDAALGAAMSSADCVLFDGTFWRSDELIRLGRGARRAEDMGHWPLGGPEGSVRWLAGLGCRRKVLVHVNNTNPVLRPDSPERLELADAGIELGYDGMELGL